MNTSWLLLTGYVQTQEATSIANMSSPGTPDPGIVTRRVRPERLCNGAGF